MAELEPLREPQIQNLEIRPLKDIAPTPPPVLVTPAITSDLPWGFTPLVDIPCVKAREKETAGKDLYNVDPDGNMVLCDHASVIYIAPDFNAGTSLEPPKADAKIVAPLREAMEKAEEKKDDKKEKKKEQKKVTPNVEIGDSTVDTGLIAEKLPCPAPDFLANYPIGSVGKYGTARVKGFKLDATDGTCITLWEPLGAGQILDNYTPPGTLVAGVFTTALIGASGALFASPITKFLNKATKPLQKKLIAFVKKKLGKTDKVLSRGERLLAQREKNNVNRLWRSLKK